MSVTCALHPLLNPRDINGPILTVLMGSFCPYMIRQKNGRHLCGTECCLPNIHRDTNGKPVFPVERAVELIIKAIEERSVAAVMFQGHEIGLFAKQVLQVAEACADADIICSVISRVGLAKYSAQFAELGGYSCLSIDELGLMTQPRAESSIQSFLSVPGSSNRLMVNTVLDTETRAQQIMIPPFISRLGVEFLMHSPKTQGLHKLVAMVDEMEPIRDAVRRTCEDHGVEYFNGNDLDQSTGLAREGELGASIRGHKHPFYRVDFTAGRMGTGFDEIILPVHQQPKLDPDIDVLPLVA